MPSVSFGLPYNCCAGSGWAATLLDTSGSGAAERLRGEVPSVSFGLPYNCCAGSGWTAKLLDTSGSAAAERLRGGRCHQSVSDYHITAVLGLAGPLSCLTHPASSGSAAAERLRGGKVPSVSFGLPYNCCAGSGWAAKLLDTSGSAAAERLRGGRCYPSVSDYHITAVLGVAGPLSCLTDRALVLRSVCGGEGAIRQFRITI